LEETYWIVIHVKGKSSVDEDIVGLITNMIQTMVKKYRHPESVKTKKKSQT
jgi:hypothetical protein